MRNNTMKKLNGLRENERDGTIRMGRHQIERKRIFIEEIAQMEIPKT